MVHLNVATEPPSGEKILAILVKLLAEQESVEITYELKK